MFGQGSAAAHRRIGRSHAHAMTLDHVLMHPTLDFAPPRLGGEALGAQRTGITVRSPADIAKMPFASGVPLMALRRPQQASYRTAVNIGRGVVDKRLKGKAALAVVAVGLRHVGGDRVRLACLQRLAIVVADIRQRPQRLGAQRLFGGQGHRMQLAVSCRRRPSQRSACAGRPRRSARYIPPPSGRSSTTAGRRRPYATTGSHCSLKLRQIGLTFARSPTARELLCHAPGPLAGVVAAAPPRRFFPAPRHRPRCRAPAPPDAPPAACASRYSPCSHRRGRTHHRSPPVAAQQIESRASITKSRFAAFSASRLSFRKLPIVR